MAQEREPARSPRWATTAYPLNSKRLTAQVFGRIAKSLELPTSAAFADLRQMVEGRLAEGDRDPRNVEVILAESDRGLTIYLRDAEGDFLEISPEEERGLDGSPRRALSSPIDGGEGDMIGRTTKKTVTSPDRKWEVAARARRPRGRWSWRLREDALWNWRLKYRDCREWRLLRVQHCMVR